ncbi:MAG: lamin tail domain-containing protein [Acidobacteria bacterium]|nr:lamin tail domain-containing protein [Acidobacteriota bacterium]
MKQLLRWTMLALFLAVCFTPAAAQYRVLFDNSKAQTAGNADWKIDDNEPTPSPTNPASESQWIGGISSWGFELYQASGAMGTYTITQLPAGSTITYGNTSDPLDLSHFQVFVCCEPNIRFTDAEKTALLNFVENGGGLFCIADHNGSDRNGDGWDSPHIWNDLFDNNPRAVTNIFGVKFNNNSVSGSYTSIRTDQSQPEDIALFTGPFGNVTGIAYHAGSAMTVDTGGNPYARGQIWQSSSQLSTQVVLATSRFGTGRIAFAGDSSPADDGTGAAGDELYDGWNESGVTDRELFLNLTKWLAEGSGPVDPYPVIATPTTTPATPLPNQVVTVQAEITDNGTVASANLSYRRAHESSFTTVAMAHGAGNTWSGSIPGYDNTLVVYKVDATDDQAQTAVSSTFTYQLGSVTIADIRTPVDANGNNLNNGLTVTVRGNATAPTANCFSASGQNDIYVQDASGAGVDVYNGSSASPAVVLGDDTLVTGVVGQFYGKLQLAIGAAGTSISVMGPGSAPAATVVTCSQVTEATEGKLIRIENVTVVSGTFPPSGSSGSVTIQDGTGTTTLFIDKDGLIDGTATPSGLFNVTGLGSQYDSASPYDTGYQIMPRFTSDITTGTGTSYTLTTGVAAGQGTVSPAGSNVYAENTVVEVTATPSAGWLFDHWSGDASGSTNPTSVTMTGNKTVYAHFVASGVTYTLTTDVAEGSGSVSPAGTTVQAEGAIVPVTAIPGSGYAFDHWSGDLSGSANPGSVTMNGNKTVHAHFIEYTPTRDLYFSEYVEGSSTNKALEIYNETGVAVNLGTGGYTVEFYQNGASSPSQTCTLSGTVADGDVFVVADNLLAAYADQIYAIPFNGDDAVVLKKGSTVLDVIGQVGIDPGSYWSGAGGSIKTQDMTLRRKTTVHAGDANGSDAFDPSVQWDGFPVDTFGGLGSHAATYNLQTQVAEGTGTVSPSGTSSQNYNAVVQVTATPAGGFTFDHWSGGLTGSVNPANVTIKGDTVISAHFTASGGEAPAVTAHPQGAAICAGGTAGLTVTATGTAPLHYQWYQGNSGDTGAAVGTDSAAFTTPALSVSTAYWVRVTNAYGSDDSDTALVTVNAGPDISTHPQPVSIPSGQTTTLTVTASGSPVLHYQWYQGNAGDTSTPVGTDASAFTTPALTVSTSYWVRVTNGCGTADSQAALVTVEGPCTPPEITTHPSGQSLCTGGTVALNVLATGTGPLHYQWYRGNAGNTTYPVGADAANYTTPALTSSTAYWVRVTNACGSDDSTAAALTLRTSTAITVQPADTGVDPGQTAGLTVTAVGEDLHYQWYQGLSGNTSTPVGSDSPAYTTPPLTSVMTFWVRVTGTCGSADSRTVTVSVSGDLNADGAVNAADLLLLAQMLAAHPAGDDLSAAMADLNEDGRVDALDLLRLALALV